MNDPGRNGGVFPLFEYFAGDAIGFGGGGGIEGPGRTLLRCADEGAEEAVGQRVDPRVHGDHVGIDYARVGGIDPDASGAELLGQSRGVEREGELRLAVCLESFVFTR